ncbi:hypothetical protein [Marispirochaeta aestuarii]|uniref:hypothetical protein n=1 Tax=Marispirochaeta aestuarii TaxID=1963862 RepID=UPI0029C93BEF|nr:hypothetical protein [Marispirochaeta aestuarii]
MKKLLVLFVALAVASTAFAADFSFSWDTDFGWAAGDNGDFDVYNEKVNEMELAVAADVDEYNSFSTQIEPGATEVGNSLAADTDDSTMFDALFMDSVKITTDLGAYFALSGVGLVWTNGYFDAGDQEYADQFNVGNQFVEAAGSTSKDLMTKVTLDFGMFAVDASANWDLMGKEYDGENTDQEFYISAYSTSLVEGLAVEVNFNMADNGGGGTLPGPDEILGNADDVTIDEAKKSVFDIQANYVYDLGDGMMLTFAGEFGMDSEGDRDAGTWEQMFGAGAQLDYAIDEDLTADVSVSFMGDDDESFRVLGGGASLYTDVYGLDVDMNYAVAAYDAQNEDGEDADGDLLYTDISAWFKPGAPKFRLGYAMTEFGQSNNSRATVPVNGGLYMKVECDF